MSNNKEQYLPLSYSSLKAFARSPLAFLQYKNEPRNETPAMRFGTMVHRRVLEEDTFMDTVAVYEGRRAGGAYERFKREHAGKDILTATEMQNVQKAASSIMQHPLAAGLISDLESTELEFKIEQLGIPHRGFIDGINHWCLLDLKVTQRVDDHSLMRTIYDFKYYMQAAIYERAATLMGYELDSYFIVAVESAAPHHVNVVELEPHYIARGHMEWEMLLKRYKAWDGTAAHSHEQQNEAILMDAPAWVSPLSLDL